MVPVDPAVVIGGLGLQRSSRAPKQLSWLPTRPPARQRSLERCFAVCRPSHVRRFARREFTSSVVANLLGIDDVVWQTDQCNGLPSAPRRVGAILASVCKADFALAVRKAFQSTSAR